MKNILKIIFHDFKRLTSSVVAIVILMGIIVVPCLFAWFNILSNDDPFQPAATGRIPVAVYSEDEGTDMLGLQINVGEKVTDTLAANDMIGWDIVDDKDAAIDGVKAGDYYAAVIVPADFSNDILSFATGDLRHPRLLFYENQKTNAIAPKITGKVREVLEEEADAAFVGTIGQYVTEAASAAQKAGLDPADAFSDLSKTMRELEGDLAGSIAMMQAASGLSDAAGDLLKASGELIGNSEDTLDLGEQLLESAEGRIPEKGDASSAEKVIDETAALLSKDLKKIKGTLSDASGSMSKYNSFVQKDLQKEKKLVKDMKDSTDKITKKLRKMGLTGLAGLFGRVSDRQGRIYDKLNKLEKADASNWATMKGYINDILSEIDSAQKTIMKIQSDADDELNKKLNEAVKNARKAISQARDSMAGLDDDMGLLTGALGKSDQALQSLQGGLSGTIATLQSLQNGSRNLAELFDSFADSDMLKDVNHLMTNDAEVIAANMATPIKMEREEIYPIRNFGSVMAPFYIVLAQWIGALFAAVMIHVQVRRREGLEQVKLHELFFGRYRLFLMIGLAQALLVTLGALLYVGIQCLHPFLFILAACVNSIVFTMIVYSLVFALENIGLAISVIVMILQVAGSGGTFPAEVLPPVFRTIYPFMPFQYAMDAMRECVGGIYGHTYLKCLAILVVFGLCAIAFGLLLHKPMKGIIEKVEESKSESDIML